MRLSLLSNTKNVQFNTFKIRPAILSDEEIICENERLAYSIPWTEQSLRDCLTGNYICYVMISDEQIIGHMIFQQVLDEVHLHNVCVIPDFQNKKLGHQWMDFLQDYSNEHQIKNIILEVRVSNLIAKKLYSQRGFREIGLRKEYYKVEKGHEDALVMKARVGSD